MATAETIKTKLVTPLDCRMRDVKLSDNTDIFGDGNPIVVNKNTWHLLFGEEEFYRKLIKESAVSIECFLVDIEERAEYDFRRVLLSTPYSEIGVDQLNSMETGIDSQSFDLWDGMPEFRHTNKQPYRQITISFPDPESIKKFSSLVGSTITDKTRSIWFPPQEIETYVDKEYRSES